MFRFYLFIYDLKSTEVVFKNSKRKLFLVSFLSNVYHRVSSTLIDSKLLGCVVCFLLGCNTNNSLFTYGLYALMRHQLDAAIVFSNLFHICTLCSMVFSLNAYLSNAVGSLGGTTW